MIDRYTDDLHVSVALVRALGGNAALIVTAVEQRCRLGGQGVVADGDGRWWRAAQHEIAARTGLTPGSVRRPLQRLIADGVILTACHPMRDPFEKTLSYRVRGR